MPARVVNPEFAHLETSRDFASIVDALLSALFERFFGLEKNKLGHQLPCVYALGPHGDLVVLSPANWVRVLVAENSTNSTNSLINEMRGKREY
jgi:hypothetical protein